MPKITVATDVPVPPVEAWHVFTDADSITQWNFASDDWHCPSADVHLEVGGRYCARMEARDGSMGFDFAGVYGEVDHPHAVTLVMEDGRSARTTFEATADGTRVTTLFDAEDVAPVEMQRDGWQAILDNYRALVLSRAG